MLHLARLQTDQDERLRGHLAQVLPILPRAPGMQDPSGDDGDDYCRIRIGGRTLTVPRSIVFDVPCPTPEKMHVVHGCPPEQILERSLNGIPGLRGVDLVVSRILSFVKCYPVRPADVRALACSSSMGGPRSHESNTLKKDDSCWWVSAPNSCPMGRGSEWITYDLTCPERPNMVVRVARVGLTIPPLPYGPLSVRRFHLEAACMPEGPWVRATCTMTTLDTADMQYWELRPPIETRFVRIVCTLNADAATIEAMREEIGMPPVERTACTCSADEAPGDANSSSDASNVGGDGGGRSPEDARCGKGEGGARDHDVEKRQHCKRPCTEGRADGRPPRSQLPEPSSSIGFFEIEFA